MCVCKVVHRMLCVFVKYRMCVFASIGCYVCV
jgi:hypothetical protein